jgi:hypothetical protein
MFKKYSLSIIVILIAVAIFITGTSCSKKATYTFLPATDTSAIIITPPLPTGTKRFLALGDTYTIGQSVAVQERFPN